MGIDIATGVDLVPESQNQRAIYHELKRNPQDAPRIEVSRGWYWRGWLRQTGRLFSYLVTIPSKVVTSSIVLDGMGHGAWRVMLRRANALFRPPSTYNVRRVRDDLPNLRRTLKRRPDGAMAQLADKLSDTVSTAATEKIQYDITLVGHSMGAIILNQLLAYYGEPDFNITDIVYMAPACSIQDAELTLILYLRKSPHTRFHLLTLHPTAEFDEKNAFDLVPRGSLLHWIETWYDTPPSHAERRLGTWQSALQALQIYRGVEDRVSIKAFGVAVDSKPQKHGDFNDCPFWRKSFWDPDDPTLY